MYCFNCGNKVDDKAYVCVNCGVLLKNRGNSVKIKKKVNTSNVSSIFGLIFGILSFVSSFSLFFYDISEVGMFTKVYERFFYGVGFTGISLLFTIVSLVFAIVNRKNNYGKGGLILTLISFFLILSEIFVIIIY